MLPMEQIHPLVVHFPIVFIWILAVFDAAALWRGGFTHGRSAASNVSTGLAVSAGLFAALAFIFGDLALDIAKDNGVAAQLLETHEELGHWAAGTLAAWAVVRSVLWWRKSTFGVASGITIVTIEFALAGLIVATAYFGGQLVYEYGVGVNGGNGG
ncbi:MAG: DUF2231 domain-containing protein [Burkholderiaceae bacterium]